jgi:hypothetical protein
MIFRTIPMTSLCFKRVFCLKQPTKRILTLETFSYTILTWTPFGFEILPFIFNGSGYNARSGGLIYPGVGYYVEVTGVSTADALPLQFSISAFDLGPIIPPEPSTWTMMLLGVAGLGVVARRRRRSALVLRDAPHNPTVHRDPPRLLS